MDGAIETIGSPVLATRQETVFSARPTETRRVRSAVQKSSVGPGRPPLTAGKTIKSTFTLDGRSKRTIYGAMSKIDAMTDTDSICVCQTLRVPREPNLRDSAHNWTLLSPKTTTVFHTGILENGLDVTLYFKKDEFGKVVWPKQSFQVKQALYYMQCTTPKFKIAVNEMIRDGIAREMPFEGLDDYFFNHRFPVDKPDGSVRPVGNYRALNKYIFAEHFKMESMKTVRELIRPNDWMCYWDLKKCYFQIPLAENSRKYTCFWYENKIYAMWQCDFGINILPLVCTKMMKPFLAHIRDEPHSIRCVSVLDDGQTMSETGHLASGDGQIVKHCLGVFGWKINSEKSDWNPKQSREFLGNITDSIKMEIILPERKIVNMREQVSQLLNADHVTLRALMSVHGTLGAGYEAIDMIGYRLLETKFAIADFVRNCQGNFNSSVQLSPPVRDELTTFSRFLRLWNGKSCLVTTPDLCIATDASDTGYGACILYGKTPYKHTQLADSWSHVEELRHINWKETVAVTKGARALIVQNQMFGVHILFQVDSTTVHAYLRHRSKGNRVIARMVAEFLCFLSRRKIEFSTAWVSSADNKEADDLSRDTRLDHSDYTLNSEVFSQIQSLYGNLEIDLFASRANTRLPRFVSWKPTSGAEYVDALSKTIKWSSFYFYANPPFILLSKVMNKIRADAACGVVIVPRWPAAPWWSNFRDLLIDRPFLLPRRPDLFTTPTARASCPAWDTMVCLLSNASSCPTACTRKISSSSKRLWPPGRWPATALPS